MTYSRDCRECLLKARQAIYIDESGFAHDMPRRFGYAPLGERCFGSHDWHAKGRGRQDVFW